MVGHVFPPIDTGVSRVRLWVVSSEIDRGRPSLTDAMLGNKCTDSYQLMTVGDAMHQIVAAIFSSGHETYDFVLDSW